MDFKCNFFVVTNGNLAANQNEFDTRTRYKYLFQSGLSYNDHTQVCDSADQCTVSYYPNKKTKQR